MSKLFERVRVYDSVAYDNTIPFFEAVVGWARCQGLTTPDGGPEFGTHWYGESKSGAAITLYIECHEDGNIRWTVYDLGDEHTFDREIPRWNVKPNTLEFVAELAMIQVAWACLRDGYPLCNQVFVRLL